MERSFPPPCVADALSDQSGDASAQSRRNTTEANQPVPIAIRAVARP
jgi:hypothetical protein